MPKSCLEIKTTNRLLPSGAYWINLNGTVTKVWCDQTTDGGGWTLVLNYVRKASGGVNLPSLNVRSALDWFPMVKSQTLGDDEGSLFGVGGSWGHMAVGVIEKVCAGRGQAATRTCCHAC